MPAAQLGFCPKKMPVVVVPPNWRQVQVARVTTRWERTVAWSESVRSSRSERSLRGRRGAAGEDEGGEEEAGDEGGRRGIQLALESTNRQYKQSEDARGHEHTHFSVASRKL